MVVLNYCSLGYVTASVTYRFVELENMPTFVNHLEVKWFEARGVSPSRKSVTSLSECLKRL